MSAPGLTFETTCCGSSKGAITLTHTAQKQRLSVSTDGQGFMTSVFHACASKVKWRCSSKTRGGFFM